MTKRRHTRRRSSGKSRQREFRRGLNHETLEKRELLAADMATGPCPVGVSTIEGGELTNAQLHRIDAGSVDLAAALGPIHLGDQVPIIPGFLDFKSDPTSMDLASHSVSAAPIQPLPLSGELVAEGEVVETALDRYVAKPDASYTYSLVNTIVSPGLTTYIIDMTSQTWRTAAEVDKPVWKHWVEILVPNNAVSDTAVLTISGGSSSSGPPTAPNALAASFALQTGQVIVSLPTVPNQPLAFTDETITRSEDAIIAYSFDKFLNGGDEEWPALLPMVKSAVRAMDTAQDFLAGNTTHTINDFVVTGASKRGWTTWLTAAVDPRVTAIVPAVIDVLNIETSIDNHQSNYAGVTEDIVGGYAEAIHDYTELGVFDEFGTPRGDELAAIIDPYAYRDRLTMPKYLLNSAGDQFFTPDSSQFYIHDLAGPTYLRYVPNTGHGLNNDAFAGAATFIAGLEAGIAPPVFDWTVEGIGENSIRVNTVTPPAQVNLWQATNPNSLDFRISSIGPAYTSTPLVDLGGGEYVGTVSSPQTGGTAFFVELVYQVGGQSVSFTTEARIARPVPGTVPTGPRLVGANANGANNFAIGTNNRIDFSPKELTFRFDGGQQINPATLDAFRITASGGDGTFGEANDVPIEPGFIGLDDSGRVVTVRFASTLADDQYQISIGAIDNPSQGLVALRNIRGEAFVPVDAGAAAQLIEMDVELGPQVVAVVPQPITGTGASRVQHRDQIFVYFNDDPLGSSVTESRFYNLSFTADTIEPGDDGPRFQPTSVVYEPDLNRAILTFSSDLSDLTPEGSGTFRLRVGSSQPLPTTLPADVTDRDSDVGDTFAGARVIEPFFGIADASIVISGEIEPTIANAARWPGINSPGVRDSRRDAQIIGRPDTHDGVDVYYYNFAKLYGLDASGENLETSITPAQMQRTREILDLYSQHLGVRFIETEDRGLQIVTGDLRAIVKTASTGVGAPYSEFRVNDLDPSRGLLVLDAAENWFDGYGLSPDSRPSWFVEATRGIGSLLGIGNTFEQVPGVASGSNPALYNATLFPNADGSLPTEFAIEPDFLSFSDIIPGQALHRPEIGDADLYRFTVSEPGRITIETFAERISETSLLDTDLKLWRLNPQTSQYDLVARNDDFYGDDSFIGVEVGPNASGAGASYVIGITAKGNDDYNPNIAGSGSGGRSQGHYDMRITYQRTEADTIKDASGSRLDGNADGTQGGDFNFWFRVAQTKTAAAAGQPRALFVNPRDGIDAPSSGTLATPYRSIQYALAQAAASNTNDIVRLLPDGGADGNIGTTADNRPYQIGAGLADGNSLLVPKGVTVMIDAGAIIKLGNAKISVGSESIDEDRSLAALQVLGAPWIVDQSGAAVDGTVLITSIKEERRFDEELGVFVQLGIDNNPLTTTPRAGDWAGIEFRNDVDYSEGRGVWETEGIFLDYVSHADIQYGGGSLSLVDPIVTPLQMLKSRPTLIHNQISNSRDAAMSADPDSFLETNFHAPLYQQASIDRFGTTFTSDYDRIGPHIRGNTLVDNSINGLFVRVLTPAVGQREPMTVSGRFDDQDITHVLSEVLVLNGSVGGPILSEERPDALNVLVSSGTQSGTLAVGSEVHYRITYITKDGFESVASEPTDVGTVGASGSLRLQNLPTATDQYSGRRLYRSTPTGDYELVTQLDRGTQSYIDQGTTRGGLLSAAALNERTDVDGVTMFNGAATGTLTDGASINYRLTFYTDNGLETLASEPTDDIVVDSSGSIALFELPVASQVFSGRNLYRLAPEGHYELVAKLNISDTIFVDDGTTLGTPLSPNLLGGQAAERLLPRVDARLSIDPGIVMKIDGGRIEAGFGADFTAEGTAANPIIFTSRLDDSYGAGGTFDTNNDGQAGSPEPGDWGGLIFRQGSSGSIDHAVITYGGGENASGGGFETFNPVEILQADVRLAHSIIAENASGHSGVLSHRGGIGFNAPAAIFVRGAQPVIVDNVIIDNAGAALSINPDALNHLAVADPGRSTGAADLFDAESDNQGPLIVGNQLDRNAINGMVVRDESLTTESVWDDTDIVHVVLGQIYAWNHHHRSGLRLKSDPDQSLVVKFGSGGALVADRYGTGTADSIGGTLQVIGQPGFPVVSTSIHDCDVGAGFTPSGLPQNDTANSGGCAPRDATGAIDIVILLDDTGSFTEAGLTLATVFPQIVAQLQSDLPDADLAFGIARFEDYATEEDPNDPADPNDRPFILNQPVIRTATPGFQEAIDAALNRSSPGFGGDGPESAIEALWQIATGAGFDGNDDGDTTDSGDAGLVATQTNPGEGGDVPAFVTFTADPSGPVLTGSGTEGGVGWRANASEKIILLASDINYQYQDDGATEYVGVGGVTVPATTFSNGAVLTTPGGRGATIQATIDRLIADGITVIGMGTGATSQAPMEALATLTGGVDSAGNPRYFEIDPGNAASISEGIVNAIIGDGNPARPGDWYGLVIDAGANDRNVAFIPERERGIAAASLDNAIPSLAQKLGSLAKNEKSSDENRRLGFNVRGSLSQDSDLDVYSFTANGGTRVFLDIDDTDFGFDTIVELIDSNGNILALSDNSLDDAVSDIRAALNSRQYPLRNDGDASVESPNPLDAGMQVILPGNSATVNQYFVRVRSNNHGPTGGSLADLLNPTQISKGKSHGQYQLSIRLRETDEIAGSTVRLADIRYATVSIDVAAIPNSSPLASEYAEPVDANGVDTNDSGSAFDGVEGSAQFADSDAEQFGATTGAILITDDGQLRTSGVLGNHVLPTDPNYAELREMDIDVYQVAIGTRFPLAGIDIDTQEPDTNSENRFISTIFDIDYADQVGGANTSLAVYNSLGQLILHGRDSNIADDQGRPTLGNDPTNLAGGSSGTLDAYIGPVELQEGVYYVVVSSAQMIPAALDQLFESDPTDTNVRILPIDSTRRIGEEGFEGITTTVGGAFGVSNPGGLDPDTVISIDPQQLKTTAEGPTITPLFDDTSIVPYTLETLQLFVTVDQTFVSGTNSTLISVDPFTGQIERLIGGIPQNTGDLAIRRDGELFSYSLPPNQNASPGNTGNFLNIDSANAAVGNLGDDGLTFQRNNEAGDNTENDPDALYIANALTFVPQGFLNGARAINNPSIPDAERALVVGNRSNSGRGEIPSELTENIVYSILPTNGAVTNQGSTNADLDRDFGDTGAYDGTMGPASQKNEYGVLDVSGTVTGIAYGPQQGLGNVYAVTDTGHLYSFSPFNTTTQPPSGYDRFITTVDHGMIDPHPDDLFSIANGFVEFTGVTLGPTYTGQDRVEIDGLFGNVNDFGPYSQILFGITADSWIYAFGVDSLGNVQSAPVLVDGNHAIPIVSETGFPVSVSPTGLAFSTRQENPWHVTSDRSSPGAAIEPPNSNNAVHGTFVPHNQTRVRTLSSNSLYFGFEIDSDQSLNTLDGGNGTLAPGGALGTTVSRPFSLEEYSSGDQPTLYFSYFLETEADQDFDPIFDPDGKQQTDSFRVFAAGDDGQWRLVSTNDTWRSFSNTFSSDEYDYGFLEGGSPVQELFDNTDVWRQARVDLSPLAGHKNVQIRFDFATGGGMRSAFAAAGDLTEIQAVAGEDLVDGDTFTLSDTRTNLFGLPISLPTTFEFVRDGSTPSGGTIPIFFNDEMTTVEVRDAIRAALAAGLGATDINGVSQATIDNYTVYGVNRIRLYGKELVENQSTLGFSTYLPGDEFGSQTGSLIFNDAPGASNNIEGVYIDDIVIGFAERGETVLNAPTNNRNFVVLPETRTFSYFDPATPLLDVQQPEYPNEVLTGAYTLEIRQGAEYGVPEDYDPIRLQLDEQLGFGRSFDTNDRLNSDGVTLIVPGGADLLDGDTIDLTNEFQTLTFEFDSDGIITTGNVRVAFTGAGLTLDTSTDSEVARNLRDAINSTQARSVLGIYAAGTDGTDTGRMNGNRIELFGNSIQVNHSGGRFLKVDLVAEETFYGREGARTLPIVDHQNQTVVEPLYYDTFAQATVTDYVDGSSDTLVAVGRIGDRVGTGPSNELLPDIMALLLPQLSLGIIPDAATLLALQQLPDADADIIKVRLNEGDQIDIDVDSLGWNRYLPNEADSDQISSLYGPLDLPIIEVFSERNGIIRLEATSTLDMAPGESYAGAFIDDFTADQTGNYFIRVSANSAPFEVVPGVLISLPTGSGDYQLTVRPSDAVARDVVMVDYHFDFGDTNHFRDQGQLIIEANTVSHFAVAGVLASFNPGSVIPENPAVFADPLNGHPGAAALLRNPNTERLLPGTVISNNLIVADQGTGIIFSGDATDAFAPVPFGRIVNNTVVGPGTGIGIDVLNSSSPTLLNNIVAGFDLGINIATNSGTTVTGGNAFQGNTVDSNRSLAGSSIVIAPGTPLFQEPGAGNYVPAAGSAVIDSSFASLVDRQATFVETVKEPVGIAPSPIIAPVFDANGVPRFDDPSVTTPGGIGDNVFIDRGALDRSDFVSPIAALVKPQDYVSGVNSLVNGGDIDPQSTFVQLSSQGVSFFEVQLLDPSGTGPDARTINAANVVLTEDGIPLVAGQDYTFGYSANSRVIRLTPLAGQWRDDVIYDIILDNGNITDLAGNSLQENRFSGETRFTIVMSNVTFDFGDAPESYGTLFTDNGARHTIDASQMPRLGPAVDSEATGQPTDQDDAIGSDDEDGVSIGDFTSEGTTYRVFTSPGADLNDVQANDVIGFLNPLDPLGADVSINVVGEGWLHAWIDFDGNGAFDDDELVVAGLPVQGDPISGSDIVVNVATPTDAIDGQTWMRVRVAPVSNLAPIGTAIGGEVEDYPVQIISVEPLLPGDDSYSMFEDGTDANGVGGNGTLDTQALGLPPLSDGDLGITQAFVSTEFSLAQAPRHGSVVIDPVSGHFVYTPDPDYNSEIDGDDTFTYRLGTLSTTPVGTVTIAISAVNDAPAFEIDAPLVGGVPTLSVLESDDPNGVTIPGFAFNAGPGPVTALDEQANQELTFTIENSVVPAGLMSQPPQLTADGQLVIFPTPNAVGSATYTVKGVDSEPGNPGFVSLETIKEFTIIMQPVNDVPGTQRAGESDSLHADESYTVGDTDHDNDQLIDPVITYTLREDNTQPDGQTQPYFIPIRGTTNPGYNRIGLADVFNVGPANESDSTPGGGQTLELVDAGIGTGALTDGRTTTRGGTLTPVFDGANQLLGFNYVPPKDFNTVSGGADSFTYEVRDDGTSYDLDSETLLPDPRSRTNRVELILNPVNDAPVFAMSVNQIVVQEDSSDLTFAGFTNSIGGGPIGSAFDENDIASLQGLTFLITPLDFDPVDIGTFFSIPPVIDPLNGTLTFETADNVFGTYRFAIQLMDDGASDPTRGDINLSAPQTLTIVIQPVNDPPVVDPLAPALEYTLQEEGSIEILIQGAAGEPGLLDAFAPGPLTPFGDEGAPITPGGNQTVSLGMPIPNSTTAGGSLELINDGGPLRLRYTPRANFSGLDTFVYSVIDDGQTVGPDGQPFDDPRIAGNTVSLNVLPVNDAPLFGITPIVQSVEDEGPVSFAGWATNVQAGPTTATDEISGPNAQGLNFLFTFVSGNPNLVIPSSLTASIDPDTKLARLFYQSATDQSGSAVYEVRLQDDGPNDPLNGDQNTSVPRTFTIEVAPVNDPPSFSFISNDPVSVAEDSGPFSGPLLENISPGPADEASQTVSFEVQPLAPEYASLFSSLPTIDPNGILRFTTALNQNTDNIHGPVPVRILARDSEGAATGLFGFEIEIGEVNDRPIANSDSIDTDEDSVLTINVASLLANDVDPDLQSNANESLRVQLGPQPMTSSGVPLVYNQQTGEITYDPRGTASIQSLSPGESRIDSFTYSLIDTAGLTSNVVTVSLNVDGINDAPTVVVDTPQLAPSGSTIIRVLDNDSDIDGNIVPTSIQLSRQPALGTVTFTPDGVIIYTPFNNFTGVDTFSYTVADNLGLRSQPATVTISSNASPIVRDDASGTFIGEPVVIHVAANDEDSDGLDLASIVIVDPPLRGQAIPQSNGTVQYVPAANFVGQDTFTYRISDTLGRASGVARVTVQVVASRLQNPVEFADVNADGKVSAIDALLIINHLRRVGNANEIPVVESDRGPNFYDVSGNQVISALDALRVVNVLSIQNVENEAGGQSRAGGQTIAGVQSAGVGPVATESQSAGERSPLPSFEIALDTPGSKTESTESTVVDDLSTQAKIFDTSMVVANPMDAIDLIAASRDKDDEREAIQAAIDSAMADLL